MFGTLIESRPTRQRRRGSAALSGVIHLTVIAGAVAATVSGRPAHPQSGPTLDGPLTFVRSIEPPQGGAAPTNTRCELCIANPLPRHSIVIHVQTIDENWMPRPNWDSLFTATSASTGSTTGPLVDNPLAHSGGIGSGTDVFKPDQVERAVAVLATVRPAYPETLRAAGIEGRVVVRFIVDTTGRVERGSVTTIESTHSSTSRCARRCRASVSRPPRSMAATSGSSSRCRSNSRCLTAEGAGKELQRPRNSATASTVKVVRGAKGSRSKAGLSFVTGRGEL